MKSCSRSWNVVCTPDSCRCSGNSGTGAPTSRTHQSAPGRPKCGTEVVPEEQGFKVLGAPIKEFFFFTQSEDVSSGGLPEDSRHAH